eukprot:COSAG02_NODE_5209_length_4540_cov_13.058771_7_plen_108_part_01
MLLSELLLRYRSIITGCERRVLQEVNSDGECRSRSSPTKRIPNALGSEVLVKTICQRSNHGGKRVPDAYGEGEALVSDSRSWLSQELEDHVADGLTFLQENPQSAETN